MINKFIGGILLIIGTSIGGGLLALPMATAGGGFFNSLFLFIGAWLVMTFGAFFILEVNLWLPEHTNMLSMAGATLGKLGKAVTWFIYLLLLYALLCAYIAGGTDVVKQLVEGLWHSTLPQWISELIFIIIFGAVVHCGIRTVDRTNRLLMCIKLGAYGLLIILVSPHVNFTQLHQGEARLLPGALMVVVTSFGYATIIPSLRSYFKSHERYLRMAIGIGSAIPLICYLLWDFVVQGSVAREKLMQMSGSPRAVSELTTALSAAGNTLIGSSAHVFTVICVTTSFLGVALCLWDFLADGFSINKSTQSGRWRITAATLAPPLLIVLFWPGIFVKALAYAGVLCVVLLMLLPGLMAWSGRYVKKFCGYQVWGGRWVLALEIILAAALAIYGLCSLS